MNAVVYQIRLEKGNLKSMFQFSSTVKLADFKREREGYRVTVAFELMLCRLPREAVPS
jgi:hypothetical protein